MRPDPTLKGILPRLKLAATLGGVVLVGLALPRGAPAATSCPAPGKTWTASAPASVGLDGAKLQSAFDWATAHESYSVLVVRHGCLAGASRLDPVTSMVPLDGWSMTKSVVSMLVGRAVTLGRFDIDKPIGTWVPGADAAHAALTPRQLLTMSSGLHRNWIRDVFENPIMPDSVADALSLRFDHAPGTWWEYQQTPVTLLGYAVERAVGKDLQSFAQEQLFGKIGIAAGSWIWDRDRAGHTHGWAHLHMRSPDWARLGYLMLHGGNWNGTQLISSSYVQASITRNPLDHANGMLWWLNGGDTFVLPAVYGQDAGPGELIPGAPHDMYLMAGMQNQRVYVIPSLDLVIVRLGEPGSNELDTRSSVWTGRAGELDHELLRRILESVTDVHVPDMGPYRGSSLVLPPTNAGMVGDATELNDVMAGAGVPRWGPAGCTPAGCG